MDINSKTAGRRKKTKQKEQIKLVRKIKNRKRREKKH